MERLNKDAIILLALELDLSSILNLCYTNKKFNTIICQNNTFWRNILEKEYPDTKNIFLPDENYMKIYYTIKNQIRKDIVSTFRFSSAVQVSLKINVLDLPTGTPIWIVIILSEDDKFTTFSFLTREKALKFAIDDSIEDLKSNMLLHTDRFIDYYGETPEEKYGFDFEQGVEKYTSQLKSKNYLTTELPYPDQKIYFLRELFL